jgi:hypothetical protein
MSRLLALLAGLLIAAFAASQPATNPDAQGVRIERSIDGRGWVVSANVEPPRSNRLEEAVLRGVALHFVLEFELLRPRWYWWDQRIAQQSTVIRFSYHALAREFRIAREDGKSFSFDSFEAALASMSQVNNWRIELSEAPPSGDYIAQIRLRLDTSQLPRPFQVDALTNREWNPQVEWTRTTLTLPPTAKNAQ